MKKAKLLLTYIILAAIIATSVIFVAGCGGGNKLSTPVDISVDEDNRLTWSIVENARSYIVNIKTVGGDKKGEDASSRRTYYSLGRLEEGDYEIKIRAIGDGVKFQDSPWSETFAFHKDFESGFLYSLINNSTEYTIYKVGTAEGEVVIEDIYRGKPVTQISGGAFKNNRRVTKVTVGNNVKTIGDNAFFGCSKLTSAVLPESITSIGSSIFHNCTILSEVNLPSKVTAIPKYAFAYCRALKTFDLKSVTQIGESAFLACSALTSVKIPDTVESIGSYAYEGCTAVENISVGKNVNTIGQMAFKDCTALKTFTFAEDCALTAVSTGFFLNCQALTEVNVPAKVTSVGQEAFRNCTNLEKLTIPQGVTEVGAYVILGTKLYDTQSADAQNEFIYADKWVVKANPKNENFTTIGYNSLKPDTVGIAASAFSYSEKLASVQLNKSVKYVCQYAFFRCSVLWRFAVQDNGLEEIGYAAFGDDVALTFLALGNKLTKIGAKAFAACTNLNNSTLEDISIIPDSVTEIGQYAFYDTALWNESSETRGVVYAGDWVVGFNDKIFNSSTITLSSNVKGIANYAFLNCEKLRTVIGLNEVKRFGVGVFMICTNLSSVTLNRNLKTIPEAMFYRCESLFSVSFPSSLESIGTEAFAGCRTLNSINLSDTQITEINSGTFMYCENAKAVTFNNKIKKIGDYAFYHCESLSEVKVPDSVKYIGGRAFSHCTNLSELDFGNGVSYVGMYAFDACDSLETVTLPDSLQVLDGYAFYKCSKLENVEFGSGLEFIGNGAFYNNSLLQSANLPQSVKTIGALAFKGCINLNSIVLGENVEWVGSNAFYGCENLTIFVAENQFYNYWSATWNSSYRPVILNVTVTDGYVSSFVKNKGTVLNAMASTVAGPERNGYDFVEWVTDDGAAVTDLSDVADGTKLTAVWAEVQN